MKINLTISESTQKKLKKLADHYNATEFDLIFEIIEDVVEIMYQASFS